MVSRLILIAHNIRSTHNIGALFRTSDGFGVEKIIISGYSPFPYIKKSDERDPRLPHLAEKIDAQIHKTALGAEKTVPFSFSDSLEETLEDLKKDGYTIVALEQNKSSIPLKKFSKNTPIALLIGEEVHGIEPQFLALCETILEIPMTGKKESFNVSVATGIALYELLGR